MFVVESLSRVWTFCNPIDSSLPGSSCPQDFPGKNIEWVARQEYWVSCQFLLQGIFLTQWLNPWLLHWQADSLSLSDLGSRIQIQTIINRKLPFSFSLPVSPPLFLPSHLLPFYLASFNVRLMLFFVYMINSNNKVITQKVRISV